MGTDNLFHKRKARPARDLGRRQARRAPYEKVLIACEGEKTEPHYFQGLKDHYGLNSANVEIAGQCGSAPTSIFKFARQRYREEKDAGDPFDRVFCVFDRDTHESYDQTVDAIFKSVPKGVFVAATSVPCFEYWFLLHFLYSTRPYNAVPGNSACNQLISELKNYLPDYAKGRKHIYEELLQQLEFAKSNAERSLAAGKAQGNDNPSTRIHELVDYLQELKTPKT